MGWNENRHNREKTGKYRVGMILVILFCVIMALVLAGVLLNNHKNDIRMEGISLYEQGKYSEALLKFEEGSEAWAPFSNSIEMDMYWYVGSCYLLLGDYVHAKMVYEIMLAYSREPERITTYQKIAAGLTAYMEGSYEEAIECLALHAGEDCPALYLYLGSCYMELSRFEEMIQAFDAYRELGFESDFLHAELASYYMSQGDYQTAQTEVAAGLALMGSYTRELRWQEVCCLEYMLDYNGAYEKMHSFAEEYTLNDAEKKEWDFLQTRYVETDTESVSETGEE